MHISPDIRFAPDPRKPLVHADFSPLEQDRKFYGAVVIRESDDAPASIGNPIWLV